MRWPCDFRDIAAAVPKNQTEIVHQCICSSSCDSASTSVAVTDFTSAVVDLKMGGAPGLVLFKVLHELDPNTRVVVLTGYASVATAVVSIKLGATQYLSKPANADEIVAMFNHAPDSNAPLRTQPARSTCTAAPCSANWPNRRYVLIKPVVVLTAPQLSSAFISRYTLLCA